MSEDDQDGKIEGAGPEFPVSSGPARGMHSPALATHTGHFRAESKGLARSTSYPDRPERTISRRHLLKGAPALAWPARAYAKKRIATIVTEYRLNSHAYGIVGRLIEGYEYDGKRREPAVQVLSMYTDQLPNNDRSRGLAAKYPFKIYPSVREALTLGGERLSVDGVLLIGEHGNYPDNEKGQKLYPRYLLYQQIIEVFRASRRSVPLYCDKHLWTEWTKAKQMYDEARELRFPLTNGRFVAAGYMATPTLGTGYGRASRTRGYRFLRRKGGVWLPRA